MDKEELKKNLEHFKFDYKYLREKMQEVSHLTKTINEDKNLAFMFPTIKYEQGQVSEILEKKKTLEQLIQKLRQPFQTVLYFKYISFLSFYDIAEKLEYSTKRVYQLHSEGLDELLKIVNESGAKF